MRSDRKLASNPAMPYPKPCVLKRHEIQPELPSKGMGLRMGDTVWVHRTTSTYAVVSREEDGPQGIIDIRCLYESDRKAPKTKPGEQIEMFGAHLEVVEGGLE